MSTEPTDQPVNATELQEAHQNGCATAAWCLNGSTWSVLSAGEDARLCTRQGPELSVLKNTENTREGLSEAGFLTMAVSPSGKQTATTDSGYVKVSAPQ
jgi:hypothetical protein